MRRFSVLFFLLGVPLAAQAPELQLTPPAALESIQGAELLAHAKFFASDELGGRLTGSPGQEAAARYIVRQFEGLGLEPLGDVGEDGQRGFYQHYGITRTALTEDTALEVGTEKWADGFAVLAGDPVKVDLTGKLRFAGYGRTRGSAAEIGADESLEGVIPVVLVKLPRGSVDRRLGVEQKFMMSFQSFGRLGKTAQNLGSQGAAAVLFVMPEDPFGLADVLNYMAIAPGKDSLAPRFRGADRAMAAMAGMLGGKSGTPSLVLSTARSKALLAALEVDDEALQAFVDGEGDLPASNPDVPAALHLEVTRDDGATASNVVAVLRGSDPELAAEAIVYSAHMDHVGRRLDGEVFNGADDNASGTAGLIAIAGAFARAAAKGDERPRRSVVFLAVSGEELGLWGSAYYAENPTWQLEDIVANINTDMIGRSGPESGPLEVTVTPSHRHKMFSTIVQRSARLGEQLGVSFTSGDKYYMRSDHYNFAKKDIPVVFFCNGEHEDYHQVTDHADKLDPDKMERIARLAFWTGWETANADERPRRLGRRESWR